MSIKQKFSSIDQSKLTADQKAFLDKIKNVTKNFTDAEMNKKVEQPLDNFIAKAKEKMPEAIKSAPAKSKAKTSQTRKPKRTAMSLAKEIRKEGESWKDAQVRARKMMKEGSQEVSKTVETELDKLSKLVRSQKSRAKLSGLSGTNIKRDSVRRAKPKGRRISKDGNVYYENRDNRTDRLAPNYPKNAPFLAEGGYLTDPTFGNFQNQVLAEGGNIDAFTLRMVKSNGMQPAEVIKEDANVRYKRGGSVTNERRYVNKDEDYEVRYSKPILRRKGYQGKRDFELGGTVVTDLAGHTDGGTGGLNAGMPLDGYSDTGYTGLVGETGAMSSSEMFMNGGGLPSGVEQSYMITQSGGNPAQHYARGGGVRRVGNREYSYGRNWTNDHRHINKGEDHEVKYNRKGKFLGVFKEGGAIENQYEGRSEKDIWNNLTKKQRYHFLKDHENEFPTFKNDLYELANEEYDKLPRIIEISFNIHVKTGEYNRGGSITNERRYVNKGEDYEVRYAKPRPSRKGYKGARKFMAGGSFANGGGVENKYNSMSKEDKEELMREKIGIGRTPFSEYEKYNQLSNYHKEEVNKHFNSKKFMAGGMNKETPRIYVADLEAYNNGRLEGEWLDLADYNDADELMDAIQDVLKKSGGEEYAIHDYENFPSVLYSEYMSKNDFQALYDVMETAKENDLPLAVVQEIVSQYGEGAVDEFQGKYDNAEDFAYQLVDDLGIESFIDFERYLIISETDRRLLAQEMADSYVDDIRDEDGGNRLIEEAGMDVSEYEEADNQTQDEMLDRAREIVYDEYYDTWYDGLNDPYYFLVEEQGMYSADDFAKANFVQVDYEALADALEYDYTFVYSGGDLYVFNIR